MSEDGLTWTFKIREGVQEYHSGEAVTAKGLASVARELHPKGGNGAHYLWGGAAVQGAGRCDADDHDQGSAADGLISSGSPIRAC